MQTLACSSIPHPQRAIGGATNNQATAAWNKVDLGNSPATRTWLTLSGKARPRVGRSVDLLCMPKAVSMHFMTIRQKSEAHLLIPISRRHHAGVRRHILTVATMGRGILCEPAEYNRDAECTHRAGDDGCCVPKHEPLASRNVRHGVGMHIPQLVCGNDHGRNSSCALQ